MWERMRYKYADYLWLKINGNKNELTRRTGEDARFDFFLLFQSYFFIVCLFCYSSSHVVNGTYSRVLATEIGCLKESTATTTSTATPS